MTAQAQQLAEHLQTQIGRVVFGAEDAVRDLAIALIGRGHVLLEGPPGVGKTLLAKSFAEITEGRFRRIQGTADLMPADITGVHVYDGRASAFEFQPGPVFADVLLVDEVNRASPKTQAALLEAMEERQVTVDRETFDLADEFLVVATQNPREFEGTYPLPESQLDRFMLRVEMGYPERRREADAVAAYNLPEQAVHAETTLALVPPDAVRLARAELDQVRVAPELIDYVLDIATATRRHEQLALGLSTRGAVMLVRAARIAAAIAGSDYAVPDDVKSVAPGVVTHRLVAAADAALEGTTPETLLADILASVPVPR